MPGAPNPSLIVSDPAPLNPTDFPYAVQEFPAQTLRDVVGLFRVPAGERPLEEQRADNRYEQ